jgi:glycosyltransferase involved in cell wall biosynthesis
MSPLPVAFDVSSLVGVPTGIAASVAGMVRAVRSREDLSVRTFAVGARVYGRGHRLPPGTRRLPIPTRMLVRSWAGERGWPLDAVIPPGDVIHFPAFIAPPSRRPTLITVHDCAFALHPETTQGAVESFAPILRRALARGAWVHCSTRAVADEVASLFGGASGMPAPPVVVPFGVPALGGDAVMPAGVEGWLGDDRLVVAIGALGPRKNLPRLVRAFGGVAAGRPDVRLVLAGPDGPDRAAIDAALAPLPPEVRGRVLTPGPVDARGRLALLRRATALAYPSIYEGFGFPMLEAMQAGVPVLAGDVPALREVAGDAALFADPIEVDAIAAGLSRLLDDEGTRADLVARGGPRASGFTWARTGEGLAAAYRALAATSS